MRKTMMFGMALGVVPLGACSVSDKGTGLLAMDESSGVTTDGTTLGEGGSDTSSTGGNEGSSFIIEPPDDGGFACDVFEQDCPTGQKCMPWAHEGDTFWTGTRCSDIADDAVQVGDVCLAEGSGLSGIDNCEGRAMCWGTDPETNAGVCVAFCGGTAAAPICEDVQTQCAITNDGALALCLPTCDPLSQNCGVEGEACYPTGPDSFACAPDIGGQAGAYGDECEFLNVCDPGLWCAPAATVPGCTGAIGCCTPFCDLADADPDAGCPGTAQGQQCVEWYAPGQAPPDGVSLGTCVIPP